MKAINESIAYEVSAWHGEEYKGEIRILTYEPGGRVHVSRVRARQGGMRYAPRVCLPVERPKRSKFDSMAPPAKRGELTLMDEGRPYAYTKDRSHFVRTRCSCGAIQFVKRYMWYGLTGRQFAERCSQCSYEDRASTKSRALVQGEFSPAPKEILPFRREVTG
jgi:hypothetical protein